MEAGWGVEHHSLHRSPSNLSEEWDYQRPPPFEPKQLPRASSSSRPRLKDDYEELYSRDYSNAFGEGPAPPYVRSPPSSPSPIRDTSIRWDIDHVSERSRHWALAVFNGSNPVTAFRPSYQLDIPSTCDGTWDPEAYHRLRRDGFTRAVEITFASADEFMLALYHRSQDDKTRVLISTGHSVDEWGSPSGGYCMPLTLLELVRVESSLHLRRKMRLNGATVHRHWALLNFAIYERMVLFYCTFIAMKYQDMEHPPVLDSFNEDLGLDDVLEFSGVIRDGEMKHALRMYVDRSSGVVRLQATALRGPMQDVPIWTAFITKYCGDPDWVSLDGDSEVSLAAVRPPPYVFVSGYQTPKNLHGEYILKFDTLDDARHFVESWMMALQTPVITGSSESRFGQAADEGRVGLSFKVNVTCIRHAV